MGTLLVKKVILAGLNQKVPVYVEPGSLPNGDVFTNSGRTFIHVINGSAGTMVVTINTQIPCNQGVDDDAEVAAILTTEERMIGPFPKSRFNDANGQVQVKCDVQTDVLIAAIEVP